ncbi:hypothetical protein PLESTM_001784500 [Pleodorina starrii]|nr:hypothetical protein PLESTM_001784500 [Pleodorina starrii]
MEQLDKDQLPQNWRAPLIKVVSNHVWQACERVDMTDPANHPSGDGSGKSPAYGAYAGPVESLLNNAFEGALKNWEIGPFAAWIGKTQVFNDLDLQWDFAISLPNQHLTRPVGALGTKRAGAGGVGAEEEDIPVEEQWSLIVWLKPGERGTTVDMRRFVAVVDKMANPAFTKSADGSWDIFLSHYQVHETDPRFGAAPSFNDYVSEAPSDLKQVFNLANSIPWYREEEFRAVSIKKILQAAGRTAI